jgi:hypothetical protein
VNRLRKGLAALTTERGQSLANLACVAGMLVVGALDAWFTRQWSIDPDGISYIDIARGFAEHGPAALVNGYWSPLYPATIGVGLKLLAPGADFLYPMVRAINFAVLVAATFAFARLLRLTMSRDPALRAAPGGTIAVFILAAWGLFHLLVSQAIGVALVTPDMGVAAFTFFVASELLALQGGAWPAGRWVRLGVVLAVGYWWKAILFPVGGLALVVAAGIAWRRGDSRRGPGAGTLAFGVLVLLLAIPVSSHVGRPTLGETGRLNHLWFVSGVPMVTGLCTPAGAQPSTPGPSTLRVITARPLACHTGEAPASVTHPIWYDPSPWYSQVRSRFSATELIGAVRKNVASIPKATGRAGRLLGSGLLAMTALGAGLVAVIALRGFAHATWPLLVLGVVPVVAYFSVYVELRHITAFALCIALATLAALAARPAKWSRALLAIVMTATTVLTLERLARRQREEAVTTVRELRGHHRPEQESVTLARALADRGLVPGDRVATINTLLYVDWAQRAGVVVRAFIPEYTYSADSTYADLTAPCTRALFLDAMRAERIRAVVLRDGDQAAPAWFERVGETPYRLHVIGAAEPLPPACGPTLTPAREEEAGP